MVECLAFEGMAPSMWLLGKLSTVCDAMNDTVLENPGKYLRYVVRGKLSAEILVAVHLPAHVRDQYLAREFFEVHQVNRGLIDASREEAHHYCDDCKQENPATHNVAEVINIDGVS